jgi:hypothetical protein
MQLVPLHFGGNANPHAATPAPAPAPAPPAAAGNRSPRTGRMSPRGGSGGGLYTFANPVDP